GASTSRRTRRSKGREGGAESSRCDAGLFPAPPRWRRDAAGLSPFVGFRCLRELGCDSFEPDLAPGELFRTKIRGDGAQPLELRARDGRRILRLEEKEPWQMGVRFLELDQARLERLRARLELRPHVVGAEYGRKRQCGRKVGKLARRRREDRSQP